MSIHVDVPCTRDAADLVEFLETRGLDGELTAEDDHCELEVSFHESAEARLQDEFETALSAWLQMRERPLVPVSDREHHGYVLRPPGD